VVGNTFYHTSSPLISLPQPFATKDFGRRDIKIQGFFERIIGNFVTNAHKFTQQGSVELGLLYFKNRFILYVSDSGCGIEAEKQKLVFRRFTKLNQTATGTGLGMAICQSIVESRNGHIGIYSKVDEGSIFYTILPEKVKKIHPDKFKFKNINHILEHIDIFPGKTFI